MLQGVVGVLQGVVDMLQCFFPDLVAETLQAAISDAYHHNFTLHMRLLKANKKDEEAGKELSRASRKPKK